MPKKTTQAKKNGLVSRLSKVMSLVEGLKKQDLVPPELGVYFVIAIVKDKSIITETVLFDTNELGVNVENFEKVIIHQKLLKKYKARDKEDQKSQKKRFKSQIKQSKKEK